MATWASSSAANAPLSPPGSRHSALVGRLSVGLTAPGSCEGDLRRRCGICERVRTARTHPARAAARLAANQGMGPARLEHTGRRVHPTTPLMAPGLHGRTFAVG